MLSATTVDKLPTLLHDELAFDEPEPSSRAANAASASSAAATGDFTRFATAEEYDAAYNALVAEKQSVWRAISDLREEMKYRSGGNSLPSKREVEQHPDGGPLVAQFVELQEKIRSIEKRRPVLYVD